ncbi:MAG: hypothetical protein DRG87_11270 [Deltaproteobacteria bacterium]|nr:hypothetical protein [Deltaproteobacteria bacterium]MBW2076269.1 hypothetical protein [Deltaproteobacteria bacterium]MBW2312465.1 hypothetical protein [Deltaproteobacteria bacterium]RLB27499.1 MAG: hypothetical protein DRG87_11270 [Deltaproteobacteria bacterium]
MEIAITILRFIGIIIGVLVGLIVLELAIAALVPGFSVPRQRLGKERDLITEGGALPSSLKKVEH